MTREEAIRDIEECVIPYVGGISLRMAVEALKEQRPHGEWEPDGTCSECGVYSSLNKNTAYFCPDCGADMRGGDRNDQAS